MKNQKYWLMLTLCNLFWAGNYVFGKFVVTELSPVWMTFTRWFFACFLLFPIAHILEKPDWKKAFKEWPMFILLGCLGYIGYNTTLYTALSYTSSTNASLVNALNPGLIFLMSALIFKEKISYKRKIGLVVSLLGVIVILTKGNVLSLFSMTYNKGDLIMFLAILIWSIYSLIGRRFKRVGPITATAFSAMFTTLILLPFAVREGFMLNGISNQAMIGLIYIVIFPSVLSFIFWNVSVLEVGAGRAGIFMNLNPVFTAIISVALGAELMMSQAIGGGLVLLGVSLTTGVFEKKKQQSVKQTS